MKHRVHVMWLGLVVVAAASCGGGEPAPPTPLAPITPDRVTAAVTDDADDPAIWLHPADLSRSLIIGTNKVAAPTGALVVFGLDGAMRQTVAGIDRPNNVDMEHGVTLDGRTIDVAITTERLQHRLRVFEILKDGSGLAELGIIPVLDGQSGDFAEPMGIGLYRRPSDGVLFAVVAPKLGPAANYLWQYRIDGTAGGGVTGTLVRRFGNFSEKGAEPGEAGEIEAIVVDDALGYVYYADERHGIHKWHADPDHADASRELAVFGLDNYQMDREGLALYVKADGTGYLVSTDQVPGGSTFKLYRREGEPNAPHRHVVIAEARTTADATDGIEVTSAPLPGFPQGVLVAMNSNAKNFALFAWERLFPGRN
ncbi:MAG: phytase [Acidimicrobiia bacterium]|nr:phytase [Acidimicrobiia bacterium]